MLPLAETVEIAVQMKVSTLQETVTVTGDSPVVDTASAEVSTNFNREWVENAPLRRFTFFDLINQAAGVSPPTSTSSRSQRLRLGDQRELVSARWHRLHRAAHRRGVAVAEHRRDRRSAGALARRAGRIRQRAGAVFNVVTRQGSNKFHGDANFYFQNQSLTGRNTDDAQDGGLPYNRDEFKDTTMQLGGPIMKDKLWFFGSFQYQKDAESQPGTDRGVPGAVVGEAVFLAS